MLHHNEDFVKFHEKVSARTLCAAKFNHRRKDKKNEKEKYVHGFGLGSDCLAGSKG